YLATCLCINRLCCSIFRNIYWNVSKKGAAIMRGILYAKFIWLYRNPWTFIAMTAMTIVFALIMGGSNLDKETIPVYTELNEDDFIIHTMKENELFEMEFVSKTEMKDSIQSANSELGMVLKQDSYEIVTGIDSPYVTLAKQVLDDVYLQNEQLTQLTDQNDVNKIELADTLEDSPVFILNEQTETEEFYDNNLYPLYGMALFLVIYTIAYSVFQMLVEKKSGIWDRIILSPAKKWEMYTANFIYSSIVGYLYLSIMFLLFRFVFDVDFGGKLDILLVAVIPYVLTIVSLIILIVGIVKTVQQFNVAIPIVSLSMAMLGGAFWPLEIVDSDFMLLLSNIIPIKYGLDLLNGITSSGYTWEDMLEPTAILLLMSVVFTGIGIHLMEKRFIT